MREGGLVVLNPPYMGQVNHKTSVLDAMLINPDTVLVKPCHGTQGWWQGSKEVTECPLAAEGPSLCPGLLVSRVASFSVDFRPTPFLPQASVSSCAPKGIPAKVCVLEPCQQKCSRTIPPRVPACVCAVL